MGNRVTPKEEAFCRAVVLGKPLDIAYKEAYNTQQTGQMLFNSAVQVHKRKQVQERIAELEKPIIESFALSVEAARTQQIAFIKERIEVCRQKEDEQSIIRYTDMLNKIHGIYREQTSDQAEPNKLESIDADALARIAEAI